MTLEQDLLELDNLDNEIFKISENPNIPLSEKIIEKRRALEYRISKRLGNGEKIGNDLTLDYCFANFVGDFKQRGFRGIIKSMLNIKDNFKKCPSALDFVPMVLKFANNVEKNIGQKILSVYDGLPDEFGIISGKVQYHIDRNFRTLYVPVEKLLEAREGKWENKNAQGLCITSDIFSSPALLNFYRDCTWKTSHSGDVYTEEKRRGETEIYIGNENVDREMKKRGGDHYT